MNIWRDSKQIIQIQVARFANGFLYFLHKIPLIGKHIPSHWYQNYSVKHCIGIIAFIGYLITRLLRKIVYVFVFLFLPVTLLANKSTPFIVQFLYIFVILNIYMGPVFNQKFLNADKNCYTMLRFMKMETRRYLFSRHFYLSIVDSIFMYICLFVLYKMYTDNLALTFIYATFCILCSFIAQLVGIAIHVHYYDKTTSFIYRKNVYSFASGIIFPIIAYAPLYFKGLPMEVITYSFASISGILVVIFAIRAWKYLKEYSSYNEMMSVSISQSMDIINFSATMKKAKYEEVSLRDKDYSSKDLNLDKMNSLHGYKYLNKLFFKRHIRLIIKPLIRRLCIVLCAFILVCIAIVLFGRDIFELEQDILTILPPFVFLMYFMSIGEKVSKAMFMNCDVSLLHYGYYRQPKAILTNFRIRCKTLCLYNLIIASSICIAISCIAFIGQFPFTWSTLLLFNFTILCLSIFFSVHYLFVYYIFQPYNEELDMKNPFMGILNSVVYILCYFCLNLDGTPLFVSITLLLTIIYIAIALLVVYKFAPKTFHLK